MNEQMEKLIELLAGLPNYNAGKRDETYANYLIANGVVVLPCRCGMTKDVGQLVNELRHFKYTEVCIEAADRIENDENHILALQKEIHDLRQEIDRLHKENFWLSGCDDSVWLMSNGKNMMENIKPPCKGCEFREIGCHSKCDKWKEYEAIRNEDYETRKQRAITTDYFFCTLTKNLHKIGMYRKRH